LLVLGWAGEGGDWREGMGRGGEGKEKGRGGERKGLLLRKGRGAGEGKERREGKG